MRLLCSVVTLMAWVVATTPLSAQDDDELRWTPSKSMEFSVVQQTAISPDGSRIAYVVRVPLIEGQQSEYLSHIWLVNSDGTGNTQFTRGKISASGPEFSPDGEWLAFSSQSSGAEGESEGPPRTQVWAISINGGEAFPVTDAASGASSYQWSPSGDRIAYLMRDPDTDEEKAQRREKRDPIYVDQNFKYKHI